MTKKIKGVQLVELDGNQVRLMLTDEDLSRAVTSALREVKLVNLDFQQVDSGAQRNSISDKTLLQHFTQSFLDVVRVHG
ncbi:hypothetical protein L5M43_06315 [Shewanella sp. SW36]|uniref:hypothetical protein n=1 Tax=unclassified Shewanella TaxID=196818 RepID=UPI0021D91121|nr:MULTISPECIES: hypothetical protein [unclassified Shewanella]MCU7974893.1 hypothetical protein [Shewanella sp. SW36]MCU7990282.1 hypothetical protein [Shewanella sp. SW1]MCU8052740.1 hypothetical protein [Shewanella sp. SM43]